MSKKIILIVLILWGCVYNASAQIICRGSNPKQIALTFDDGPSSKYTPKILNILKTYKIKATFFVVGQKVAGNLHITKRMNSEGHEIGNHTYYHSPLTWLNDAKMLNEIKMTSLLITENTRKKVKLFRPPHGRMTYAKLHKIEKAGYRVVLWSVNSDDFYRTDRGMRSANSIVSRILSRTRGGDIILMHDRSREIVAALPGIITGLKKRGYTFVTISKLKKYQNFRLKLPSRLL